MDVNNTTLELMLIFFLAITDLLLLSFVAYSIYLFRKDTCNLEKLLNKILKPIERQTINAIAFWIAIILFFIFVRTITPEYYK